MNALANPSKSGVLILRLALASLLAISGINEYMQGVACKNWPTVEGKVTASRMFKYYRNGERQVADVKYQYSVAGKTYSSDRIQFGGNGFRDEAALLKTYELDTPVIIHYKPGDPMVACLETTFNQLCIWPGLLGAFFVMFLAFPNQRKKTIKLGNGMRPLTVAK